MIPAKKLIRAAPKRRSQTSKCAPALLFTSCSISRTRAAAFQISRSQCCRAYREGARHALEIEAVRTEKVLHFGGRLGFAHYELDSLFEII
jgi:hypothetical protein